MTKLFFLTITYLSVTIGIVDAECSFESLVSHISSGIGTIDDTESFEGHIVWLSENQIDRAMLRKAAWQIFEESTKLINNPNTTDYLRYAGETGQSIAIDYLALCSDETDCKKLEKIYRNNKCNDNSRIDAFFAHLFSVGEDDAEQVVDQLSDYEVFPRQLRLAFYNSGVRLAYEWATPQKKAAIASAFKRVIAGENDYRMFITCDSLMKSFFKDYAKSRFRLEFIQQFDPPADNEALRQALNRAIAECTNPKVKVEPPVITIHNYPPYISYEETVLAGKGIPEIKKIADMFVQFEKGAVGATQTTEKTHSDRHWFLWVAATGVGTVAICVIVSLFTRKGK
ncbi:MAG: hypothetical protein IJU44_03790 [Kiritimatiellae bacterium]|nr:hypothetical protein [Kiritimatiellia bacterium]